MNWDDYPNFSKEEFDCKETGENEMQPEFMERLQRVRTRYGKPMRVNSGYRSPQHSIEVRKSKPGTHTKGRAVDIGSNGQEAYQIAKIAFEEGFTGIGIAQKGNLRFVHLDDLEDGPRPNMWSY